MLLLLQPARKAIPLKAAASGTRTLTVRWERTIASLRHTVSNRAVTFSNPKNADRVCVVQAARGETPHEILASSCPPDRESTRQQCAHLRVNNSFTVCGESLEVSAYRVTCRCAHCLTCLADRRLTRIEPGVPQVRPDRAPVDSPGT